MNTRAVRAISKHTIKLLLWLGLAILALSAFLIITRELFAGNVLPIDVSLLLQIAKLRTPWLTARAIEITALGSQTALTSAVALTLAGLLVYHQSGRGENQPGRQRREILQLITVSIGAGLLTLITKDTVERPRPEVIPRLVVATRSSYPSGHSLGAAAVYLTIAILIAGHLERHWVRAAICVFAALLIVTIAVSRLYLGVHYPSDVAAGVALGSAWAFLGAAAFSR